MNSPRSLHSRSLCALFPLVFNFGILLHRPPREMSIEHYCYSNSKLLLIGSNFLVIISILFFGMNQRVLYINTKYLIVNYVYYVTVFIFAYCKLSRSWKKGIFQNIDWLYWPDLETSRDREFGLYCFISLTKSISFSHFIRISKIN